MEHSSPKSPPETFNGLLGATSVPGGVQFAVHAAPGAEASLLLFDRPDSPKPARTIGLDPSRHRTGSFWHVVVPGVGAGQVYAWQMARPRAPQRTLIDPYGVALTGLAGYDRTAAAGGTADGRSGPVPPDNTAVALRSVVADLSTYDWQGDRPPPPPAGREFIYELHVAAFTADPSSGLDPALRGTYAGLAAKAEHLARLGVTAVELMPVHAFDPQDAPAGRVNYWGYSPVSYFAPHPGFAAAAEPLAVLDEFRDMVRALHAAGLRVILDVVYNHTAEAGPRGPVLSWRGFDEGAYYMQDDLGRPEDPAHYRDFTGCGNTFNANDPVACRLIIDSLRHWVTNLHVDGFRFDLAAALARDPDGSPLARPPVLLAIDSDPVLAGTRLIAEAWDTGGLHLVGEFPGRRFAAWNGYYRDTVRRFLKGDDGVVEQLMARIVGSPDVFRRPGDQPSGGINFVTCHDGFTLRDLVSYEQKHNLENGEGNRDGSNNNLSWHSGVEGPTDDPVIGALRERRMRNFLTLMFFSHGTPMLLAGDEWGQSRAGNNNPWCLDNERNWLDWKLADTNGGLLRFVRLLAELANRLPQLRNDRFWHASSTDAEGDITWHGDKPGRPDWTAGSHHLAYELVPATGTGRVMVLLNAESAACDFALAPAPAGTDWHLVIDTGAPSPQDIRPAPEQPHPSGTPVHLLPHSVAVLRALAGRD